MPLTSTAAQLVTKGGLRPDDVALVLRRMAEALPHLDLSEWGVESARDAWIHTVGASARALHCHIPLAGAHLAAQVRSPTGRVTRSDRVILRDLAEEARQLLDAPGRARGSLADFGLATFSRALARLLKPHLEWEMVSGTLRSLRALASETYEGHRISYGLIFTGRPQRGDAPLLSFENKRFKTLTDGFSTALLLDRRGGLAGIVALVASRETVRSGLARPWWFSSLADTAARVGGVGVALTRGGDLLIAHRRELVVSQRSGLWMLWRHSELLDRIRQSWHTRGRGDDLDHVIVAMYRVALELALRRSGGLLVVASSREGGRKLVVSKGDLLGSSRRLAEEPRLDASLTRQVVQRTDRRIVADLASVDGALIVDRTGRLIAYGAMVRSSSSTSTQGARSRAAVAASRLGLAMKVSSDGGISVYRHGNLVVSL
jgi:DNA integrity scanning protein DisA with diadenylate cyclase activity